MKNYFVKVLALCLVLVFSVAMVACGGNTETTAPDTGDTTVPTETEAPDYSGEEGDTYVGMDYMTEDLSKFITVGQYSGLVIEIPRHVVSDAEVDAEIQSIIDGLTKYEPYDEPVTDRLTIAGDFLNIDFVGTIDGEVFEGGSAEGSNVVLAENNGYLDWFEDDLYGVMPGTTVTSVGHFPEEYYEELAGKEVTFEITINYIAGHYTIPEFNDEFVSSNTEFESAEAYREFLREALQAESDSSHEISKYQTMWQKILDSAEVKELPNDQVMYYYTSQRSMYEAYAAQYGMTYDELLTQLGGTDAELMEYVKYQVEEELVFYSIVKAENVEVTDEDYANGVIEYAAAEGLSESALVERYGEEAIRDAVLWDKLMVYLASLNTFVE